MKYPSWIFNVFLTKNEQMKRRLFLMMGVMILVGGLVITSCKKDETPTPSITLSQTEGTAKSNGEYTLTGTINSDVKLNKVIITKEGSSVPFLTDDSTAKNKNEYTFSYLITGITVDTYIIIDIYDLNGGKKTVRFLIHKA